MTYQPHQSEDGTLKPVGGDLGSSILTAESPATYTALRSAFESWAQNQGVSVKRVSERPTSVYTNYETHLAWEAWKFQASRHRQLLEVADEVAQIYELGFREDGLWESVEKLGPAISRATGA